MAEVIVEESYSRKTPKGNPEPENISAYSNETNPESIVSIDKGLDAIYTNLIRDANGVSYHKSLDFSDVGMPTNDVGGDATKRLRQFHQTRLYVMDYGGMLHHGKQFTTSAQTYLISANLPESLSYKIGSKWSTPIKDFSGSLANFFAQYGGKDILNANTSNRFGDNVQSGVNRVAQIMMWDGSEPLSLSLTIPVIDDGHPNEASSSIGKRTNLVEALEFLGSLCLPKGNAGQWGFYQPPPSPYQFNFGLGEDSTHTISANHARILLQLGGILLVDNVIIKDITVNYPNTKTMIRHWYKDATAPGVQTDANGGCTYLAPLLATVTISLTTSEALTAQTYSNMLWLKQQPGQGQFSVTGKEISNSLSSTMQASSDMLSSLSSAVMNGLNTALNGKKMS